MKPALLLFLALLCGVTCDAATHDEMGRPLPEVYAATYKPLLIGNTMLPKILGQRPDLWRNVRARKDTHDIHYVEFVDDSGAVLLQLSHVTFGGGAGYVEFRRGPAPEYIASNTVGTVIARIRNGDAFSITEGEETPRPECPSIPAKVALVTVVSEK